MNEPEGVAPIKVVVMNQPFLPVTVVDVDIKFMTMVGLAFKLGVLMVPIGLAIGFGVSLLTALALKK